MSENPRSAACPQCGRVLPPDAPRGLCPRCLLASMLDGGPLAGALRRDGRKAVLPRAFGSYELIEEVARGGMGIVYKARQPQLNRVVAVKVLAAGQFAAPGFVERFRTEAEAAAKLEHPNIVPIYEVGECEGQPFFSMKFVEGGSLAGRISNRGFQISNGEAAGLLVKLARAVHYAHQRGILHRDIKPGNVLLDGRGEPQLTDFGLAKLVEKDSTLTRTVAMLGTPSYMSPEQARGEAKQLTTAVDVYGLGAVFYELLTGQPPFAGGTTMETVRQVLEKEPRRPSMLIPDIDRDLETICLKCLEKDPARRYGSAEAFGNDLDRWGRDEPVVARPPSVLYRFQKSWRRNKLAYSAALAVVLALVVGLGLASAGWRQARKERDLAQDRLYDSLVREARSLRIIRPLGYRNELMDRIRQALALPTAKKDTNVLRSEVAQCLGDAMSLSPVSLVNPPRSCLDFALDTEGKQVAFGTTDGELVVHETATGKAITRLDHQGQLFQLAFTPDGRGLFGRANGARDKAAGANPSPKLMEWRRAEDGSWARQSEQILPNLNRLFRTRQGVIAAVEDRPRQEMRLVEATTQGSAGAIPLPPNRPVPVALDVSFDEKLAASTGEGAMNDLGRTIDVWELVSRQRRVRLSPGIGEVLSVAFSRDGRYLACTASDGVLVYETAQFKPVTTYRGYMSSAAAWVGDGATLAVPLSQENGVRLFAVTTGTEQTRLTTRHEPSAVRSSLDGSVLATMDSQGPMLVRLVSTRERLRLTGHVGGVPAVEFSPDGATLASIGKDGVIRIWDALTGTVLQTWTGHHVAGQTLGFSPDGRWLASADYQNDQVLVWSVAEGRPVLELGDGRPGTGQTWSCGFSPDGKLLVAAGLALRCWELAPSATDATERPWQVRERFREPFNLRNLQFDPGGRWIALEGVVRRDGQTLQGTFTRGLEPGDKLELADLHPFAVESLGLLDRGQTLVTGERDRTLHFWSRESRRVVRIVPTLAPGESSSSLVGNFRISPDGSKVAVVNHNGLGVNIYDLVSGRRLYSLPDESGSIWWLAWHPDNRHLAVSRGDGDISLWNLAEVEAVLAQAGLAP